MNIISPTGSSLLGGVLLSLLAAAVALKFHPDDVSHHGQDSLLVVAVPGPQSTHNIFGLVGIAVSFFLLNLAISSKCRRGGGVKEEDRNVVSVKTRGSQITSNSWHEGIYILRISLCFLFFFCQFGTKFDTDEWETTNRQIIIQCTLCVVVVSRYVITFFNCDS